MQSALVDAFAVGYGISSTVIGIGLILMGVSPFCEPARGAGWTGRGVA